MQQNNSEYQFSILNESYDSETLINALREENTQLRSRVLQLENRCIELGSEMQKKETLLQDATKRSTTLSRNVIKLSKKTIEMSQQIQFSKTIQKDLQFKYNHLTQTIKRQRQIFEGKITSLNHELQNKIKDNNILFGKNMKHKKTVKDAEVRTGELLKDQSDDVKQTLLVRKYRGQIVRISQEKAEIEVRVIELQATLKKLIKHKPKIQYARPTCSQILDV